MKVQKITFDDVERWNEMLINGPKIFGEVDAVEKYGAFIHSLSNEQKGYDFGITCLVLAQIEQARSDDKVVLEQASVIKGEATERAMTHVVYLKNFNQLNFFQSIIDDDFASVPSILINAAIKLENELSDFGFESIKEFGIRMVKVVGQKILD